MPESYADEILRGVESVPKLGLPGGMVVYGPKAQAVLTGPETSAVIVAAAEVGQGRVVVFSHGAYSLNFRKWAKGLEHDESLDGLFKNVTKWVTKEDIPYDQVKATTVDIHAATELQPRILEGKKLASWTGELPKPPEYIESVLSYVKSGGGLVCGCTPWGYLQLYPGKSIHDLSMNQFVKQCGLYFGATIPSGPAEYHVSDNKAKNAHVSSKIEELLLPATQAPGGMKSLLQSVRMMPDDVIAQFLPKIREIYEKISSQEPCVPKRESPVKTESGKGLMGLCELICRSKAKSNRTTRDVSLPTTPPGVEEFPGVFASATPVTEVSFTVTSPRKDFYAVGYYAPPGSDITIEVLSEMDDAKPWTLIIGCHQDNNTTCEQLLRWPKISESFALTKSCITACNIFGGGIYFKSPQSDKTETLQVKIGAVVESPYIDISDPASIADWPRRKGAAGLWAELSGQFITFSLPSASIRDLADPVPVLKIWDTVVAKHHYLKGTEVQKAQRQWVVYDRQPHNGYMHAGYPIVAGMTFNIDTSFGSIDKFPLNIDYVTSEGEWGVFHEIGHNMQHSAWTFDGTLEVTCNIFTLHAMDLIVGKRPWIHSWLKRNIPAIKEYLNGEKTFEDWQKHAGIALGIYAQLQKDFGWDAYRAIFRKYNRIHESELPKENQAKIDQWVVQFSKIVDYNLMPIFYFWKIEVSNAAKASLEGMVPYLPTDEMIDLSPARVEQVLTEFPTCLRGARIPQFEQVVSDPVETRPWIKKI